MARKPPIVVVEISKSKVEILFRSVLGENFKPSELGSLITFQTKQTTMTEFAIVAMRAW